MGSPESGSLEGAGSVSHISPEDFVAKWRRAEVKERSGYQEHFIDLCRLIDEPTPIEADPAGRDYCFEAGATRLTGGKGFADVFRRGCFAFEYKGRRYASLEKAYQQVQQYAVALDNPPLLVACDMSSVVVHTNFTNTVKRVRRIELADLLESENRRVLKQVFAEPEALKPGLTREAVTRDAAARFAKLTVALRERGHDPMAVARFMNRLIFCLFAEDARLLPDHVFSRVIDAGMDNPEEFPAMTAELFSAMRAGGRFGTQRIGWFNGGLFEDAEALPLTRDELIHLAATAGLDWADVDPAIMGTLFEAGLDPKHRSAGGIHYTDEATILNIVEPVVKRPLEAEWIKVKEVITELMERAARAGTTATAEKNRKKAKAAFDEFIEKLGNFVALDPACGSGNVLYVTLRVLKELENRARAEAIALGLEARELFLATGPHNLRGIEKEPYAAELARVALWIGEFQTSERLGYPLKREPVLEKLDMIDCRDALLDGNGEIAARPTADDEIGNPPFLGAKMMRTGLGDIYADTLFSAYRSQVPSNADLVCYWVARAATLIEADRLDRAGLVTTNSIRNGANREILDRIVETGKIFEAWSDQPWTIDGAAVRVSLICFSREDELTNRPCLDGESVDRISADLSGRGFDLTRAARLTFNASMAYQGVIKNGPFDVPYKLARSWLLAPANPNGRPNSDVLKPFLNASELVGRPEDRWIIDFGVMGKVEATM